MIFFKTDIPNHVVGLEYEHDRKTNITLRKFKDLYQEPFLDEEIEKATIDVNIHVMANIIKNTFQGEEINRYE